MWSRAKIEAKQPKASWHRELLQPLLISLAPVAYMATGLDLLGDLPFLLVVFMMIGIGFLPLLIPQHMFAGSKLHRPAPPRHDSDETLVVSPLQRVSNGLFGAKIRDDYESRILLPEIDTAPLWVQRLIATLGARGPFPNLPRKLNIAIEVLLIIASIVIYVAFMWWLKNNNLSQTSNVWAFLAVTALIIAAAYRRAFRRLNDIYTKDAAKTGRHAFPALRL